MEVCVECIQSAVNAENGGASRIELCSSLIEGGLTPSIGNINTLNAFVKLGMLHVMKQHVSLPIFVMIRPRSSDFCYNPVEIKVMKDDIVNFKKAGADGFVFGILTETGEVDRVNCKSLLDAAYPLPVTFHRAIDVSRDILQSTSDIIDLGFNRILSSGGKPAALDGVVTLSEMMEQANGQIKIMPGGGIRIDNLERILSYCGAKEFHGSAQDTIESSMKFRKSDIFLGCQSTANYTMKVTSADIVQKLISIAKTVWNKKE